MSYEHPVWKVDVDGRPVGNEELDRVRRILAPFASDDKGSMTHEGLAILHHAFHTTHESYREKQPVLLPSGVILTWDGRLDNREALMSELGPGIGNSAPDSEIVAAAYERWQTKALSKVIGDWALSAWDPNDGSLLLAKDFVGVRQLYYRIEKNTVSWCSVVDVLVLLADHGFELDEEYVCGWLALFPAAHLTPYVGIQSVPPSSFVRITRRRHDVVKYWDFDPDRAIRYRKDEEYEVLDAVHIKPYALVKRHEIPNGLLMRSDLHRLFDFGYLTVDPTARRILVSKRIKEEFENGRDYYKLHGQALREPDQNWAKPSVENLEYHAQSVFR